MPEVYDVVVVGSGAGGGMYAKVLTEAGARVLLIDAGGHTIERDIRHHQWPWELPCRNMYQLDEDSTVSLPTKVYVVGQGVREEVTQFDGNPYNIYYNDHFWAKRRDWAYTFPAGKPYYYVQVRALGGRTNCWDANVLRWGPREWKPYSYDGFGADWPVAYQEMAPWYTRTEELIGVSGPDTRSEHVPTGKWLPTIPGRCGQMRVARAAQDKFGLYAFQHPKAAITQDYNGRPACHYCGPCDYGCDSGSKFTSVGVLLPPALGTGRLTLRQNAIVRDVLVDSNGLARGVSYIDRYTFKEGEAFGRVVVLCAGTIETARILLNSRSGRFPNGLANSSGQVGRHLVDNVTSLVTGYLPDFENREVTNEDGWGSAMMIAPFVNVDEKSRSQKFLRRYVLDIGSGFGMGVGGARAAPAFGEELKREMRRWYGSGVWVLGTGEVLESRDNFVDIDPEVKDAWGIPAPRIQMTFGENEEAMVREMVERGIELVEAAGGVVTSWSASPSIPGGQIHEQATCRMGDDPQRFVTDRWGQCHDVPNLLLGDGSIHVTSAMEAPTLTILAMSMRNAHHLAEEMRRGNLRVSAG
jgi:choline dehydrogenase-like flavoprotein